MLSITDHPLVRTEALDGTDRGVPESQRRSSPRATLPELQSHRSVKSWSKESRKSAIHDAYLDGTLPPGRMRLMRPSCPLGILVTQKKSSSGALLWRVIVWRMKFGVQFAKVRSSLMNPQQVLPLVETSSCR